MYRVLPPDKEGWMAVFPDGADPSDGFASLIRAYSELVRGSVTEISDRVQYTIDNDPLGLVFQYDGCFGITVAIPAPTDPGLAYDTVRRLCEAL